MVRVLISVYSMQPKCNQPAVQPPSPRSLTRGISFPNSSWQRSIVTPQKNNNIAAPEWLHGDFKHCQVNHWRHIRPSVTHVTALVEVTDRCKVLMSPEPDPLEERLTMSYGSHPPIQGYLHTRTLRAQQMVKTCVTQWLWTQRCSYANWRIEDQPFDFRLLRSTPLMWPWGFKSEAERGSHCRWLVNITVRWKVQTKALDRQHCQCKAFKAFNRIACLTEQSTVLYYTRAIVSPHANQTIFPAIYISIML